MSEVEQKNIALENKRMIDQEFKKRAYLKLYTEIIEHYMN